MLNPNNPQLSRSDGQQFSPSPSLLDTILSYTHCTNICACTHAQTKRLYQIMPIITCVIAFFSFVRPDWFLSPACLGFSISLSSLFDVFPLCVQTLAFSRSSLSPLPSSLCPRFLHHSHLLVGLDHAQFCWKTSNKFGKQQYWLKFQIC